MNDKVIDGEEWFAPVHHTLKEYIGQEVIFFKTASMIKCRGILVNVEDYGYHSNPRVFISTGNEIECWYATSKDSASWVVFVRRDSTIQLTNVGRKNCFKCRCLTELKRDFSTFSVREMCPRCKV